MTQRAKYSGTYAEMPTDELAQLTLESYEDAAEELHRRRPHLAGFYSAQMAAIKFDMDAYNDASGGFDFNRNLADIPLSPTTEKLRAIYTESLNKLASGELQ